MFLLFTFSDGTTMTSDFILEGAKVTECFYNELRYADDSASLQIPFNETLCDKIKTEISKNIKVQIKEDGATLFTGYARKTLNFVKTQRNQPFSVEIVSPALLFDSVYSGVVQHYTNTNLAEIVLSLLSLTDFSGEIDVSMLSTTPINLFLIHDGEKIRDVLNELLFEFGYSYSFNGNGDFYITRIFETPPFTIENQFNGDNCLKEIVQTVKEDKYNRVSVKWSKVEQRANVLIFEDTTGADNNNKANIPIQPNQYYLEEKINYLQYDSKFQNVGWIESASATIKYDSADGITESFNNLGTQGELSIYNASQSPKLITELSVYGSGFFEISTNYTKVGTTGSESTVDAKYIQNDVDASKLAKKLADYYNYSNFIISVLSKTKYDLGAFIKVSDRGIGTILCRVVKRVWDIQRNTYSYVLESITDYSPVETYITNQVIDSRGDNGETIRDTVNELSHRIDNISTETTMVSADVLSAIIRLDNEGKTITAQDITTTVQLKQSDIDLDFSIGAIPVPDGWTYTIIGNKIVFHIAEGVSLRSGQFAIPVIYRTVMDEKNYVDEDGNQYVDENGNQYVVQTMSGSYTQWKLYFTYFGDNGGIYLGMITQLSQIPQQSNYGDYFTWGADDTPSELSYDGKFLKARVYKFVGTKKTYQWSQDLDGGHSQVALSDVLGIASVDLERNNSTAYEFLNHLTSNSIYTSMIVSNQAFIEQLISKAISVGNLVTVGAMDNALDIAEQNTINELYRQTGISTLRDYTLIQNGFIKSGLIDVETIKASQGFFDDIIITGEVASGTGRMHDLIITGNSHFEGTIDSGPLLLSDASPQPRVDYYPAGSRVNEWVMRDLNKQVGTGTYGDIQFDWMHWSYRGTVTPFTQTFTLRLNGVEVYSRTWREEGLRMEFLYDFTFRYEIPSGAKTFKLRNIPSNVPGEVGMIYALDDGILRIVK